MFFRVYSLYDTDDLLFNFICLIITIFMMRLRLDLLIITLILRSKCENSVLAFIWWWIFFLRFFINFHGIIFSINSFIFFNLVRISLSLPDWRIKLIEINLSIFRNKFLFLFSLIVFVLPILPLALEVFLILISLIKILLLWHFLSTVIVISPVTLCIIHIISNSSTSCTRHRHIWANLVLLNILVKYLINSLLHLLWRSKLLLWKLWTRLHLWLHTWHLVKLFITVVGNERLQIINLLGRSCFWSEWLVGDVQCFLDIFLITSRFISYFILAHLIKRLLILFRLSSIIHWSRLISIISFRLILLSTIIWRSRFIHNLWMFFKFSLFNYLLDKHKHQLK